MIIQLRSPTLRPLLAGAVLAGLTCVAAAQGTSAQKVTPPPFPTGTLVPSGTVVSHDDTAGTAPALPASDPDRFAWTLFAKVNQKAAMQVPIQGHPGLLSNTALWET